MTTVSRINDRCDRRQIIGECRQSVVVEAFGYLIELLQQVSQRVPTGRAHLGRDRVLNIRFGRCHRIEIVQEPVHGGRLLSRLGNVTTHQFACPSDGFGTDILPKLANQLCTRQLDLLDALRFDPLDIAIGLLTQLFGDALGVGLRFRGDSLRLGVGVFLRLIVGSAGFGQAIGGSRGVRKLLAHSILAVRHQLAYRRHHVPPDQPDDDSEADQLSEEC